MTNTEIIDSIQRGSKSKETMLALWQAYKGLCFKAARRFTGTIEQDDALQEAFLSLVSAAETYDSNGGAGFMGYAFTVITNALIRYTAENGHCVRLPEWARAKLGQYRRMMNEARIRTGKEPTQAELCTRLEVSRDTLETIITADRMTQARSLSEIVGGEDDITLLDTLADNTDIEADSINKEFLSELRKDLEAEISKLKADQGAAVHARYLEGCETIAATAERIGRTADETKRLHDMGLRRLRDNSRTGRLRQYLEELSCKRQAMAYRGSLARFQMTGTSSTERAALYHFDDDRQQAGDPSPPL